MNKRMQRYVTLALILAMIFSMGTASVFGQSSVVEGASTNHPETSTLAENNQERSSRILQQATALQDPEEETEEETTEPEEDPEEEPPGEEDPSEEEAGNIRIRYIDSEGNPIADSVLHENLALGEYSYTARTIPGYTLVSPNTQSVTLTSDGEILQLDFEYVAVQEEEEAPEEEPEEEPVEEEEEAPAPTPPAQAPTIRGTVVVQYVNEAGEEIRGEDIFAQLPEGVHHFQAIEISGYELSDEETKSTEITQDGQRETIIFRYTQTDEMVDDEEEEEEEEQDRGGFFSWLWNNPIFGMIFVFMVILIIALIALLYSLYNTRKKRRMGQPAKGAGAGAKDKGTPAKGASTAAGKYQYEVVPGEGGKRDSSPKTESGATARTTGGASAGAAGSTADKSKKTPLSQKKRRRRAVLIIIGILIALILIGYVGAMYLLGRMEREEIAQDDESLGIEVEGSEGITNIAVFGIDSRDGMRGRSDAIMILTMDEINDKIKITSIMRDSYVDIPGRGMDKVNHAFAFGGAELAIRTLNQNFQLDIRDFIAVNFNSMPAIIDAMGGIEQEITNQEATQIRGINSGGTYVLTGPQALDFSRIRKIDSDFERTRRQRDVMEATIKKGLNAPVTSYPGMMNDIFPHLTTNMSSNFMLNMARKAVTQNIRTIEQVQYPSPDMASGQMIGGVYYYVFDRTEAANRLRAYLYEDQPIETNNQ